MNSHSGPTNISNMSAANSTQRHSITSLSASTIIDLSIDLSYDYSFDNSGFDYDADYEKSPDSPTDHKGVAMIEDVIITPLARGGGKVSCAFRWMTEHPNEKKPTLGDVQSPVAAQRRLSCDRQWIDPSKFLDEQSPVAATRRLSCDRQWIDPSKILDKSPVAARRRVSLTQPRPIAVNDLPRAARRRVSELRKAQRLAAAVAAAADESGDEEKEDKEEEDLEQECGDRCCCDPSSEAIAASSE